MAAWGALEWPSAMLRSASWLDRKDGACSFHGARLVSSKRQLQMMLQPIKMKRFFVSLLFLLLPLEHEENNHPFFNSHFVPHCLILLKATVWVELM